jgi:trypsin
MGMTSVDSKPTPIQAQAIIRHPRYHNRKFQHDLALVFLESSLTTKTITLAGSDATQDRLRIYGYGNTSRDGFVYPTNIQTAEVQEIGTGQCKTLGGSYGTIIEEQICAGDMQKGATDSCDGDSGGPLVVGAQTQELYGLVSWGTGCGQAGRPGVYTRLAPYHDWIQETVDHMMQGDTPLDEFLAALFYGPLRYQDASGAERQFTASYQLWRKAASSVATAALATWEKTWQNGTVRLELHSRGPQRYEWRAFVRGEWYTAATHFSQ